MAVIRGPAAKIVIALVSLECARARARGARGAARRSARASTVNSPNPRTRSFCVPVSRCRGRGYVAHCVTLRTDADVYLLRT